MNTFQASTGAEGAHERPVRQAEGPATPGYARPASGRNEYGSTPRRLPVLELVAGEPQPVAGLQVVARRRLAVSGRAARRGTVPWCFTPAGRDERGDGEERAGERYNARAAASSSSKSGHLVVP